MLLHCVQKFITELLMLNTCVTIYFHHLHLNQLAQIGNIKKGGLKEFRLSNDDQFNKTFQRASIFVGAKEKFPASVSGIKFQGA